MSTSQKTKAKRFGGRAGARTRVTHHEDAGFDRGWSGQELLYCLHFMRTSSPQESCPVPQQLELATQDRAGSDGQDEKYTQMDFVDDMTWELEWHQLFVSGCNRGSSVC